MAARTCPDSRKVGALSYAVYVYVVPWSEFLIVPSYPHYLHHHPRVSRVLAGTRGGGKTLHPTTCTLHPTPYTLHPTPYTLHPTPYTLHPTRGEGGGGRGVVSPCKVTTVILHGVGAAVGPDRVRPLAVRYRTGVSRP